MSPQDKNTPEDPIAVKGFVRLDDKEVWVEAKVQEGRTSETYGPMLDIIVNPDGAVMSIPEKLLETLIVQRAKRDMAKMSAEALAFFQHTDDFSKMSNKQIIDETLKLFGLGEHRG